MRASSPSRCAIPGSERACPKPPWPGSTRTSVARRSNRRRDPARGRAKPALGIVVSGRVALRLRVPERGPTTVLTAEPGNIVGWSAVVPPHRATSTAVALVPTELLFLDGEALRAELDADPALAAPSIAVARGGCASPQRHAHAAARPVRAAGGRAVVTATTAPAFLPRAELGRLLDLLHGDGRRIIGPTVREGAIVYDEVTTAADLPAGWTATQAPGSYRLQPTGTDRLFDFAVGPTPGSTRRSRPGAADSRPARRRPGRVRGRRPGSAEPRVPRRARLRDRRAPTQDAVFEAGPTVDRDYAARRAAALVIAVECEAPASTCFCTSMGTGPEVTSGFDLALTELDDGFLVRSGSPAGEHLAARLDCRPQPTSNRAPPVPPSAPRGQ